MRFLKSVTLFFFVLLFGESCSNDFELTEGKTNIPVVYGVISSKDTATYIRVEKAFVDEETSAGTLAKDAANLYFEDIIVKLIHQQGNKEYILQKVDGNKEGYTRDEGAFATAPNYLYKIKRNELNFIPKDDYKLVVSKIDGTKLTEASTKILTPMSDAKGDVNPPSLTGLLSFGYNSDFRVTWFPDENSVTHDIIITINFVEKKDGVEVERSVDWKVVRNFVDKSVSSSSYNYATKGIRFYEFLAATLSPSEPNNPVTRSFKDISLKILSGGQPIRDYIRIGQVNLGITSSGEIPVYTNMSNGARGIFSSKTEYIRTGMLLSKPALDSLRNGVITKKLNFQ
jgi:hypothetical protein